MTDKPQTIPECTHAWPNMATRPRVCMLCGKSEDDVLKEKREEMFRNLKPTTRTTNSPDLRRVRSILERIQHETRSAETRYVPKGCWGSELVDYKASLESERTSLVDIRKLAAECIALLDTQAESAIEPTSDHRIQS